MQTSWFPIAGYRAAARRNGSASNAIRPAKPGGVAIYLGKEARVVTVAKIVGEHPWATARTK